MTAKPINLRQFRKRKQREDKAKQAEANRIEHGMPKALSATVRLEDERRRKALDAKKLESGSAPDPDDAVNREN